MIIDNEDQENKNNPFFNFRIAEKIKSFKRIKNKPNMAPTFS